jgi:hypothetical protein
MYINELIELIEENDHTTHNSNYFGTICFPP